MVKPAIRLVLDTNIVMDILHFYDQSTQWLQTALIDRRVQCFSDTPCLAELERVVGYPEFGLDGLARKALIGHYLDFVTLCDAACGDEDYVLPRCRDADDQKFLILGARCAANLLITRDKLLLKLAKHRRPPPPFAILTAEAARRYLAPG
jgi:putative PIN family toxin of toxin-antitoxin system